MRALCLAVALVAHVAIVWGSNQPTVQIRATNAHGGEPVVGLIAAWAPLGPDLKVPSHAARGDSEGVAKLRVQGGAEVLHVWAPGYEAARLPYRDATELEVQLVPHRVELALRVPEPEPDEPEPIPEETPEPEPEPEETPEPEPEPEETPEPEPEQEETPEPEPEETPEPEPEPEETPEPEPEPEETPEPEPEETPEPEPEPPTPLPTPPQIEEPEPEPLPPEPEPEPLPPEPEPEPLPPEPEPEPLPPEPEPEPEPLPPEPEPEPEPLPPEPEPEPLPPEPEPEPLPPEPEPEPLPPEPEPEPEPLPPEPEPEPEPLPPEPEPEPEPPAPEPEPEPEPPAPEPEPEPEPPAPEPVRRPVPPAPFSETKSQRDNRLTESLTRIDDYEAFRRSTRDEREGPIPGIHLTNDDQRELLDLIAFFDLMPFAYRRSAPSEGYIAVDFARTAFTPSKNFDYLQERYAPQLLRLRSRLRRVPMLRHAAQGIARSFQIPANDLELCFATPRPLMAYLRWKAFTTCKAARLDPSSVARCEGRLVRSGARWVLRVDRIVLKDGRALTWRGA